jgi:hypothetical protein
MWTLVILYVVAVGIGWLIYKLLSAPKIEDITNWVLDDPDEPVSFDPGAHHPPHCKCRKYHN